jgi:hypothetical protein
MDSSFISMPFAGRAWMGTDKNITACHPWGQMGKVIVFLKLAECDDTRVLRDFAC